MKMMKEERKCEDAYLCLFISCCGSLVTDIGNVSLSPNFVSGHSKYMRAQNLELHHMTRDVKTVYFSKPVTGLPKPVFYRLPKGLL